MDTEVSPECQKFLKIRIEDLPSEIYYQLVNILDEDDDIWKILLSHVESRKLTERYIVAQSKKNNKTPTEILLRELTTRLTTVGQMITYLEKMRLDRALMLLKTDEPLKIIEQPSETLEIVAINNTSKLTLKCLATGFPTPKYQWYKNDVELLTQCDSTLTVDNISPANSGEYFCRVYKYDRITSEIVEPMLKSNVSSVIVTLPTKNYDVCLSNAEKNNELPTITRQPISPANIITQGSHIVLICLAENVTSYQWFCNGNQMKNEIKEELHLNYLYSDHIVHQWTYTCQVSNNYGSVLSNHVTIALDKAKSNTQYYAKDKVALLIGNANYDHIEPLGLVKADVITLAEILREKNFRVLALKDLSLTEMRNAVDHFCSLIQKGAYAVFYFVGHGFKENDSYMLPVEASNSYLKDDSLNENYVIESIHSKEPGLALILFDMCRRSPLREDLANKIEKPEPRRYSRNLSENSNILIGYATSINSSAFEILLAPNGVYMGHLKRLLLQKKPIQQILWDVHREMASEKQSPWSAGNLSKSLTLDDPICKETEIKTIFDRKWAQLLNYHVSISNSIPYLNLVVKTECLTHAAVFINSLDVIISLASLDSSVITDLRSFELNLEVRDDEITLSNVQVIEKHSHAQVLLATVNHVQRLKDDFKLKLCITNFGSNENKTQTLLIPLKKPMIAKEDISVNSLT